MTQTMIPQFALRASLLSFTQWKRTAFRTFACTYFLSCSRLTAQRRWQRIKSNGKRINSCFTNVFWQILCIRHIVIDMWLSSYCQERFIVLWSMQSSSWTTLSGFVIHFVTSSANLEFFRSTTSSLFENIYKTQLYLRIVYVFRSPNYILK